MRDLCVFEARPNRVTYDYVPNVTISYHGSPSSDRE